MITHPTINYIFKKNRSTSARQNATDRRPIYLSSVNKCRIFCCNRQMCLLLLTANALKNFRINQKTKGLFQFEIIINVLFKYICYWSTAIINIFTLAVRGSTLDVRI